MRYITEIVHDGTKVPIQLWHVTPCYSGLNTPQVMMTSPKNALTILGIQLFLSIGCYYRPMNIGVFHFYTFMQFRLALCFLVATQYGSHRNKFQCFSSCGSSGNWT